MEELKLKPCPFCGREAKIKATHSAHGVSVWCGCGCGARTEKYLAEMEKEDNAIDNLKLTERMAARAWNRRVNDETD